jgi:hypothetical protein
LGASGNGWRALKMSLMTLAVFSNSGPVVKLSMNILAGSRVLSAVDTVITVNRHFDSPELF